MVNNTIVEIAALPIGSLTGLIQALGGLIAVSIIFGIVNIIMNRRRARELKKIKEDLSEIKRIVSKRKR